MQASWIFASPLAALARGCVSLRRVALAGLVATLYACGGSADAPPPPEAGPVVPAQVAPAVTQQPADASVAPATTATFTAAASGTPAPRVQWQQSSDGGTTWASIAGATSSSFTTAATVVGDSGKKFRAVFTNAAGSATSNAATLTVTAVSTGPVSVGLMAPEDVAVDTAGTLYIADTFHHVIRKVTADGNATTFAGQLNVQGDVLGNGSAALFKFPGSIAVGPDGTVYVADSSNCEIKKISPAGDVTLLAGHNLPSCIAGLNGTGAAASFLSPTGIRLDPSGNVVVAEDDGKDIRIVAPDGVVTTLAGNTFAVQGDVDGIGGLATFSLPWAVAVDPLGTIYVLDFGNNNIRAISPTAQVTHVAGQAGTFGSADGTGAAARFHLPQGIAVDAAGTIYVADTQNFTIRKIAAGGVVTTLAGMLNTLGSTDGACASALFNRPQGLAVDSAGNIYVADTDNNSIRKITVTPSCTVTTVVH